MQLLGLIGSLIGLFVSLYIYRKKRAQKPLMCPRSAPCDTIVNSAYATTFGIPNELLGIGYYVTVGVLHALALSYPILVTGFFLFVLVIATSIGVILSVYFVALQAFVLRAWCLWCLGSAFANALLLVAVCFYPHGDFFALLGAHKTWWIIIHNIGFILGLGGATITDVLFFKFLKDNSISDGEKETMDTLSSVIWIGLAVLFLSGVMLYLPEQSRLLASSKFLLKVLVVGVITINGFFLNVLVAPKLRTLSVDQNLQAQSLRRIAFALGGISIVSWYTAFFLGSIRKIHLSFHGGLTVYLGILLIVVVASQIYERIVVARKRLV